MLHAVSSYLQDGGEVEICIYKVTSDMFQLMMSVKSVHIEGTFHMNM